MKEHENLRQQFLKENKLNFSLAIITVLLVAAMNICFAYMLRLFIEAIDEDDGTKLGLGLCLTIGYLFSFIIVSKLRKKYTVLFFRKALSQFKDRIFECLLSKSIAQFEKGSSAKFLSAFSNDLNAIEANYLGGIIEIISTIAMFIAAAAVLILTNLFYGLAVVGLAVIFTLLSLKYGANLVEKENDTAEENMGFIAQVKDLLSGFIVIKSFKAEQDVLSLFRGKNVRLESTKQQRREVATDVVIFSGMASMIINSVIFGLGFYLAYLGHMTIGMVIASIEVGNYIINPVKNLGSLISNFRAASSLIDRLENALKEDESEENEDKAQVDCFEKAIRFQNVTFSYGDDPVLHNINLLFEKGKRYAVVGGSGSGKSTLLKLLLGYLPQYSGQITYDGLEVRDINLNDLYEQISIIQQDVFLFDSSIAANITMFKDFSKDKLDNAIQKSGLNTLIDEKGLDYACGEGGTNLSGGEKQRVSVARCLVRETPILLVDEATAALDNETAFSVENAILHLDEITRIVVTHRYNEAILRQYDSIIVMKNGYIAEIGGFHELMDKKGYFYSLFTVSQTE